MLLREYWLNRLSIFCAVLGVLLIGTYSVLEGPKNISIAEISEQNIGEKVRVRGIVSFAKLKENVAIFGIESNAKIKCVIFNPEIEERIILQKGSIVEVIGKVQRYKSSLEIVVERVELLD